MSLTFSYAVGYIVKMGIGAWRNRRRLFDKFCVYLGKMCNERDDFCVLYDFAQINLSVGGLTKMFEFLICNINFPITRSV